MSIIAFFRHRAAVRRAQRAWFQNYYRHKYPGTLPPA